jgi:hypothetical protein
LIARADLRHQIGGRARSDGFGLILIVSAAESAFPGICPESRRTALLGGKRCLGCTQSLRKRQSLPQEQISAPIEKFHCRFLYFARYPHKSAAHWRRALAPPLCPQ